jgi:hypothetical protein
MLAAWEYAITGSATLGCQYLAVKMTANTEAIYRTVLPPILSKRD